MYKLIYKIRTYINSMDRRRTIFLLMGFRGMGKDTFADCLREGNVMDRYKLYTTNGRQVYLPDSTFQRLSFAQPLKEEISDILRITLPELEEMKRRGDIITWMDKEYTTRDFMIEVARMRRREEESFFARKVRENIESQEQPVDVVITDHRFPIEYEYLMEILRGYNLVRIRIHRSIEIPPKRETMEHQLDNVCPDILAVPKEETFPSDTYTKRFSTWKQSHCSLGAWSIRY